MKICIFFGHRKTEYASAEKKIRSVCTDLILKHDVAVFYNGFRGTFDDLCARVVRGLKKEFPRIRNILALSYPPKDPLPNLFDESVYLLERYVPPRFAIAETNKLLVKKADFVVSDVTHPFGGAYNAVEYAKKQGKTVIEIFDGTI